MSIQAEAMRDTDDKFVTAFQRENGKWSGVEIVNHPTPSGFPRFMPTYSDNREWVDAETAVREFKTAINTPPKGKQNEG